MFLAKNELQNVLEVEASSVPPALFFKKYWLSNEAGQKGHLIGKRWRTI
jgi:hypothetical protein